MTDTNAVCQSDWHPSTCTGDCGWVSLLDTDDDTFDTDDDTFEHNDGGSDGW